jgi:chemotaxis protein CheX
MGTGMKAEFINPFIESMQNVLSTMAMMEAQPGKPALKEDDVARGDVTGLIGMTSPQTKGSLSISFSESVICKIASNMLGERITKIDETATDLVGELTNMVTGGAKNLLAEKGYDFDMAIPAVVAGKNHVVRHKTNGPRIQLPFNTDSGRFFIEICFEQG